jgi:hypothetical protein
MSSGDAPYAPLDWGSYQAYTNLNRNLNLSMWCGCMQTQSFDESHIIRKPLESGTQTPSRRCVSFQFLNSIAVTSRL